MQMLSSQRAAAGLWVWRLTVRQVTAAVIDIVLNISGILIVHMRKDRKNAHMHNDTAEAKLKMRR